MSSLNGSGMPPIKVFGPGNIGNSWSSLDIINLDHNPLVSDRSYPIGTIARNSDVNSADYTSLWYLSKFVGQSNNQPSAIWVRLAAGGTGPLLDFAVPLGSSPVYPSASGEVTYTTSTLDITGGTNTIAFDLHPGSVVESFIVPHGTTPVVPNAFGQITITEGAGITVTGGLNQYNIALSGGGISIDSIHVDAHTAPGTDPVVPDNAGLITMTGAQVAAGTVGANAIRTDSLAVNSVTIEIQRAAAAASSSVNNNGISSYNQADFSVDANAYVSLANNTVQGVKNLGIAYSGTTFTVESASGAALSATNVAHVTLQSLSAPGLLVNYSVTANQTFTQAGLGNSLFGLTSGVDVTVDIPFYLYAVSNANNGQNAIAFMISRIPHATVSPVAGKIGQSGNTNASTQGSFFSLATITAADYASSPCLCIGSFRMRYATSLWTVQTLNNADGIEQFQEGVAFTFPRGQYGAASGKWFADNGGTAPNENAPAGYAYIISKAGLCTGFIAIDNLTTAGIGAVTMQLILPIKPANGGTSLTGYYLSAGTYTIIAGSLTPDASPTAQLIQVSNLGSGVLQNQDFGAGISAGFEMNYLITKT